MVGRIYRVICVVAHKIVLTVVRSMLRVLTAGTRTEFVEGLVESVFVADKTASLNAFVGQVAQRVWMPAEQERMFASICGTFDVASIPNGVIDAFEAASGGKIHYSQEGEDITLLRMLGERVNGYFIDVGAHHATRFSNTYALYKKGWRGINIDATPGSMKSFHKIRPEDINIECAVSDRNVNMCFSLFHEGALNTFDRALAENYQESGWKLKAEVFVTPRLLADILAENLPSGQKIDLLSVDVEGEDLAVLRSNDWSKYCPEIIIIEALDTPLAALFEHPAVTYLSQYGFSPVSRLSNSIILRKQASVCAAS